MTSSAMTMPFLILNMGSEMIYILNQRLKAQNVTGPKSNKVLIDVAKAMFSDLFICELFKPQEVYSLASTKQVFEKLAHSSIMRLNKSSMDKLYDLMTMGFKYQILSCPSPVQLMQITLVHLDTIKYICQSSLTSDLIQKCINKFINIYSSFSDSQWLAIKTSLLKFMQGKKVKVSLFLQQEIQNSNGDLIIPIGKILPYRVNYPGKVTYYENNRISRCSNIPLYEVPVDFQIADSIIDINSTYGKNLYSKDNSSESGIDHNSSSLACLSALEANAPFSSSSSSLSSSDINKNVSHKTKSDAKSSAKAELNLLSDILGMKSTKEDADTKPMKLNLFPSSFMKEDEDENYDGSSIIVLNIDAASESKTIQQYMRELDFDDAKSDSKYEQKTIDDDDDLLALMDSVK